MRALVALACLGAATFSAAPAAAAVFSVNSAVSDPAFHGGGNDHAVWIPFFDGVFGAPNGSDFDFSPDGLLSLTGFGVGNTGNLSGTIVSQVNNANGFNIDVELTGLNGPGFGGPKRELINGSYVDDAPAGPIDPATWEYFRITGGSFVGFGSLAGLSFTVSERPDDNEFPWQMGVGANNKNGNDGASAWFYLTLAGQCDNQLCDAIEYKLKHGKLLKGDFNLDLQPIPLPAGVWLFGVGLASLAAARRRKSRAAV